MWVTVCGAAVCKSKCLYVNFIKSILLLYNLTGWIMLLFKSWLNIWWFKNILRSLKHKESNWASTYCQTLYQSVTLVLVWKQLGLNKIPEVIVLPFHIICHMCVIIIHIHPALWGMEINPSIKWDLGRRDNVSWPCREPARNFSKSGVVTVQVLLLVITYHGGVGWSKPPSAIDQRALHHCGYPEMSLSHRCPSDHVKTPPKIVPCSSTVSCLFLAKTKDVLKSVSVYKLHVLKVKDT